MKSVDYDIEIARRVAQAKRAQQIVKGETGEGWVRELLVKFFLKVPPESSLRARLSDFGVDVVARHIVEDLDARQPIFHFQVKTLVPTSKVVISEDDFSEWCRLLDEGEPVFLLRLSRKQNIQDYEVKFLCWREWVLENASSHKAFTVNARNSIDVTHAFVSDGQDFALFRNALKRELEHARKEPNALFRIHEASFALPINLKFLVNNLEWADQIWFPKDLITDMPVGTGAEELTAQFVNAWQHDPKSPAEMKVFAEALTSNQHNKESCRFARKQFQLFIDAMKDFANLQTRPNVALPALNARLAACWRTFAAYFPHSLHLFIHFAKHGTSHNDRIFSLVMLPVFVIAGGERTTNTTNLIMGTLHSVVHNVGSVSSFEAYQLVREAHRAALESGCATKMEENKFIDFLHRHTCTSWELQHLEMYGGGWEGSGAVLKAEQKLNHGTLRDIGARPFYMWTHDAIPRMIRVLEFARLDCKSGQRGRFLRRQRLNLANGLVLLTDCLPWQQYSPGRCGGEDADY